MEQEKVCTALANLACGESTKLEIANLGAVPTLVEICRHQTTGRIQEKAAKALRNLAFNADANCVKISSAGGIDVLASLCEHGTQDETSRQAAAALSNLMTNERIKVELKDTWGWSARVMAYLEGAKSHSKSKPIPSRSKHPGPHSTSVLNGPWSAAKVAIAPSPQETQAPSSMPVMYVNRQPYGRTRPASDLTEMVEAVNSSLRSLNRNDINEVKKFAKPPHMVKRVIEAVCIMLDVKPEKIKDPSDHMKRIEDYWGVAKWKLLSNPRHFIQMLIQYDKDGMKDAVMSKVTTYVDDPEFDPDSVGRLSWACSKLCLWVKCMYSYHQLSKHPSVSPARPPTTFRRQDVARQNSSYASHRPSMASDESDDLFHDSVASPVHPIPSDDQLGSPGMKARSTDALAFHYRSTQVASYARPASTSPSTRSMIDFSSNRLTPNPRHSRHPP